MTTIQFLAEWALRSSVLILSGALLLGALRVKDPSIRLAAWTAMLCGSLAIPALTAALPKVPLALMRAAARPVETPVAAGKVAPAPVLVTPGPSDGAEKRGRGVAKHFDWALVAVTIYVPIALALLLRVCAGLAMSLRLLRDSRATDRATEGIEIRESGRVASPVTLGMARLAIVLPSDWRQWDCAKLDAVLAHERSHIRRRDPAVQLLSAIHRALLWYSPLSWFLHQRIVRVGEEASDDAAVAVTGDRALYAEVLLDFMQRGMGPGRFRGTSWVGVPMARYGRADERIHRILDGTTLSSGVTRWSLAAILALGSPLAYMAAAAQPVRAIMEKQPVLHSSEVSAGPLPGGGLMAPQMLAQSAPAPAAKPAAAPVYLTGLGNVTPYSTVTIKPRIDGQLISVSFKEGDLVQAGQVVASLDPHPYQLQLTRAQGQLDQDQAQLADAKRAADHNRELRAANLIPQQEVDTQIAAILKIEGKIRTDQADVEYAKLQMSYTQIAAPITGLAGLRLVDAGNIVHATDAGGILIITQIQPITVLFNIPEDRLPEVRARLKEGRNPAVEAWNRESTVKIATGRLTAVDNQIDATTGTAKLKAVFDNKYGALFPNQFVVVRLLLDTK